MRYIVNISIKPFDGKRVVVTEMSIKAPFLTEMLRQLDDILMSEVKPEFRDKISKIEIYRFQEEIAEADWSKDLEGKP